MIPLTGIEAPSILKLVLYKGGVHMTREESVFLAKKLYVELVYNTAYIEGVNVTFPQTQTIIDGGVVNNVAVDDIQTVLNLRDGWKFILNSLDAPITLDYLCKVNDYVSRNESLAWGTLRTGRVGISGTDYEPEVPEPEAVAAKLAEIAKMANPEERALEYFCYAVRSQLFWDGNKRTSTMLASKVLIENGCGVLTIDPKHALAFNEGLLHYYNTNEPELLKQALRDCVKHIDMGERVPVSQRLEQAKEAVARKEKPSSRPSYEEPIR